MHSFILAQTTSTSPSYSITPSPATTPASPTDFFPFTGSPLHFDWRQWFVIHDWYVGLRSIAAFLLILLLCFFLIRAFRAILDKYQLLRPVRWGTVAIACYVSVFASHLYRMADPNDLFALTLHKLFAAIILTILLRFIDRLLVIPILTRGGRVSLSRFVHQIVFAILALLFFAGYVHWAFGLDISSVLAGSAVISIILGLALQETLGNFFSGMVLQASVPFAAGDWITIGEGSTAVEGRVVEMTWRAVTLLAPGNNNILIPNSVVARTKIINYHTPSPATATSISLNLPLDLPPHEAQEVLLRAAADTPGILADPAPSVSINAYNHSSIAYALGFWIDKPDQHGGIEAAVRWNAWYRVQQASIKLPTDITSIDRIRHDPEARATDLRARLEAIRQNSLFSGIAPDLQQKLAAETTDFYLAPGQVFYRQEDPGDSLFLVLSGTVSATMRAAEGRDIPLDDTSAGGVFGEVSALTGTARAATVIAKTNTRVAQITRQHLQELLAHDTALAQHMSQVVAQAQALREQALQRFGATHPAKDQPTETQSIFDRMKSFLNLIHH